MIQIRHPTVNDGGPMWELARMTSLDLNSSYSYLMLSEFFSDTCLVCMNDDTLVGFLTALEFKREPDTLFVWQITVDPDYRQEKLALRMIEQLAEKIKPRFIQANITRANKPSIGLFSQVAELYNTKFTTTKGFTEDNFPDHHDSEMLIRVGPIYYERESTHGTTTRNNQ